MRIKRKTLAVNPIPTHAPIKSDFRNKSKNGSFAASDDIKHAWFDPAERSAGNHKSWLLKESKYTKE